MDGTEELIKLKQKLKLHIIEFEKHKAREEEVMTMLLTTTQQNTDSITNLVKTIEQHIKTTEGLVEAYNTLNALQRFIKWLSGFALIGATLTWILTHLPDGK